MQKNPIKHAGASGKFREHYSRDVPLLHTDLGHWRGVGERRGREDKVVAAAMRYKNEASQCFMVTLYWHGAYSQSIYEGVLL